jgi:hypothetical protein
MELPALDSIGNAAKVFEKLQAPPNTSCALQAAFLRNVLIQHEAIQERRTSSLSHMPAAPAAPTTHQSATTHAQTVQRSDTNPAHSDENVFDHALEDASSFDIDFVDDEAWAFLFANAGFNIDQGAFFSPT